MGVERIDDKKNSGQSVLEFLLVVPLLVGMTMLMIRVNTVTQMAIVNQRYAREQIMFVAGNGAEYPMRSGMISQYGVVGGNVFTVGVSDTAPASGDTETEGTSPASAYNIARSANAPQGSADPGEVPDSPGRTNVRVRNTVSICMPFLSNGPNAPVYPTLLNGNLTQYAVPNDPKGFSFCSTTEPFVFNGGGT